ncbi:MAG: glycosyl hydrolase family 28-related protein [Phycisphaerae bacterium]
MIMRKFAAVALLSSVMTSPPVSADAPESAQQLWREFSNAPTQRHSHLPDFSWAGYGYGEREIPEPDVVANVREHGAVGDGQADDTEAFRSAIAAAKDAGGGAVLVPHGRYRLTGVIHLDASDIVLRGEGVGRSTLFFERPLEDAVQKLTDGTGQSRWSWSGGLLWVGPDNTFDDAGRLRSTGGYERWGDTEDIGPVAETAEQGAFEITLDESTAGRLSPGDLVLINYHDPPDHSLLEFIGGHELMKQADWNRLAGTTFRWPVEIETVEGRTITLRKPLRLPVRRQWNVKLTTPGPHIREVGIEHLTVLFPRTQLASHNRYPGYNGIYVQKAVHCWVRDVLIVNADNGILTTSIANCTFSDFTLSGRGHHHGTYSKDTHDVLFDLFRLQAESYHGINCEGLASGVVWRRGRIDHGTFDSHRNMPFDLLREHIRINSRGRPGGASSAGPFAGRRVVHWNVLMTGGSADWVACPDYMPNGALVGVRGTDIRRTDHPWAMPPGDKGCIVVDHGRVPNPPSLYDAQLQRRLRQ